MRNKGIFLLFVVFFWGVLTAIAQTPEKAESRRLIEKYLENIGINADLSDIADQLDFYTRQPLNINKATFEELTAFPFFTPGMVLGILNHRKKYGELLNINELLVIDAFNSESIRLLKSFISVKNKIDLHNELKSFPKMEIQSTTGINKEKAIGYTLPDTGIYKERAYKGSRIYYNLRYKATWGTKLSMGFTIEKDAGEKGVDFFSGHLSYKGSGMLKSFIVGDYQATTGSALLLGTGLAMGKTINVFNVRSLRPGIRPYRGLNESEFLRGTAVQLGWKRHNLTLVGSYQWIDGNLYAFNDSNQTNEVFFRSQITSGYHRNQNELNGKHNVHRYLSSGHYAFMGSNYHFGATILKYGFDVQRNVTQTIYNYPQTQDKSTFYFGTDYSWRYKNLFFTGELASGNHLNNISGLHTLMASLGSNVDMVLLYRHYHPSYNNLFASAFGQHTQNNNENGLYTGISLKFKGNMMVNGFIDLMKFKWPTMLSASPSSGSDAMAEWQWNATKTNLFQIRARRTIFEGNRYTTQSIFKETGKGERLSVRLNADVKINKLLYSLSRAELTRVSSVNSGIQNGFLVFQEFQWKPLMGKYALTMRYSLFDIAAYDGRIFAYESDVPLSYTIKGFYGKGISYFIMYKRQINRSAECWIRVERFVYNDRNSLGSGTEKTEGNKDTYVKLYLKIRI